MQTVLSIDRCVLLQGDAKQLISVLPEHSIDAIVTDPPAGIGFMNKAWDKDKGGRDQWVEWLANTLAPSYRALKPGGHALVWALPRTSHWTAWALELCGFEIRDRVAHLFGTGFPKSLDIAKEIDGRLGVARPILGNNPNHRPKGYDGFSTDFPTGAPLITGAATKEARQWEGWGTALKPACEDWWLVRKPLEGTYAENVLKWGVGGLNIDDCRVEAGRWPAHLALDEEVAGTLDASQPIRKAGKPSTIRGRRPSGFVDTGADKGDGIPNGPQYGDSGGPSRFFYVTKPSKREKNAGCEAFIARTGGEATDRKDGSVGLQNPRAGAGRGGGAQNFHPTVKSVELMRWLCRLITPPGGIVLDPFCGSASTGVAALSEKFEFVGVEENVDYIEIAKARLEYALKENLQ